MEPSIVPAAAEPGGCLDHFADWKAKAPLRIAASSALRARSISPALVFAVCFRAANRLRISCASPVLIAACGSSGALPAPCNTRSRLSETTSDNTRSARFWQCCEVRTRRSRWLVPRVLRDVPAAAIPGTAAAPSTVAPPTRTTQLGATSLSQ
ncbi:hypothetical protein TRVL_10394 [Trypanosoma vivax]|nr:hypothetical protein TRVL_10394 [Trypanosoma vivax]